MTASVVVLAHGIGGRQDLPVPLSLFVSGATVVLVVSFVALATLWPEPRLQGEIERRPVGGRALSLLSRMLSYVGLLALCLVIVAGLIGIDNSSRNPASVLVFIGFWLVIPFLSALVADIYPAASPWALLGEWFGFEDRDNRFGYGPAVPAFIAFTWLELVSPRQGPRVLALAAAIYTVYLVVMGTIHGRRAVAWSFDGFSVYSRMFGAMAPLGVTDGGQWFRRPWLKGLVHLPERPGLDAMAVAMIGTVTYDGAKSTAFWSTAIVQPLVGILPDWSPQVLTSIIGTVGLLGAVGLVGIAYRIACAFAKRLGGGPEDRDTAVRFAHTLVPIAFAYAFAHYFTLVLFEGQLLFSTMSDPFGLGWNLFGTVDRPIDYSLIGGGSTWVWYVQVAVIVLGHVGGIVLAHDRALADFPPANAVRSQYPMLALMVVLTGLGLTLLAAG